jgi:hypothetical protein
LNIIAVDWGKDARKRAAYRADLENRAISPCAFDGSLAHLIDYALTLEPPVLIGIDAAIGFPVAAWRKLTAQARHGATTFLDFLLGPSLPGNFFDPVRTPEEWSPQRPFVKAPTGRWSLTAFVEASDGGFYRQIDRQLNGNPIFLTSGIPGSVGSGTRALWLELIALAAESRYRVWPFHGPLRTLLERPNPVIAEIYPKACYGIALAEALPSALMTIAKTRRPARQSAISRLSASDWFASREIICNDFDAAIASEDDFDALISAAALMRLFIENAPIESPATVDPIAEGGVLGAASLAGSPALSAAPRPGKTARPQAENPSGSRTYPCPIPGCAHVFHNTRGGWDAHVASLARHPQWHPDLQDPVERKRLFKQEFADWFRRSSR